MTVIIVVTHLLGSGHLARALVLAKAFAAAGHKMILVSGGMPVAHLDTNGIEFMQLPPVRSDGVDEALDHAAGCAAETGVHVTPVAGFEKLQDGLLVGFCRH